MAVPLGGCAPDRAHRKSRVMLPKRSNFQESQQQPRRRGMRARTQFDVSSHFLIILTSSVLPCRSRSTTLSSLMLRRAKFCVNSGATSWTAPAPPRPRLVFRRSALIPRACGVRPFSPSPRASSPARAAEPSRSGGARPRSRRQAHRCVAPACQPFPLSAGAVRLLLRQFRSACARRPEPVSTLRLSRSPRAGSAQRRPCASRRSLQR